MKWITVLYETVWFRCHPITGPVAPDDPMPTIYPTWAQAFDMARTIVFPAETLRRWRAEQ